MGSLSTTVDKTKDIDKAIDALLKSDVYVGIPSSTATPKPDPDGKTRKLNNAVIGYIQEHGAPEANIPARPFLNPGVANAKDKIISLLRKAAKNAISGNYEDVERGLNAAGLAAQISAKAVITSGIPPELSDATKAARRRKGRTGTTPLLDTGQLMNAITYVIRRK